MTLMMKSPVKKRREFTTQMLRVLRQFGPMSDKLLCFHMSLLGYRNAESVKRKRHQLAEKCMIRRSNKVLLQRGHLVAMWKETR